MVCNLSSLVKAALCLCIVFFISVNMDAQTRRMSKKKDKPFMHMSIEAPLWLSNPNTLDNSHKAGFGFRLDFPISRGPLNFFSGFSHFNYGDHINLLDIAGSSSISGNEGTLTYLTGTYALKYATIPLGFKIDNKYWSSSLGMSMMFSLNQAEIHGSDRTFDFFGTEEFEDFSKEKVNSFNSSVFFSFAGKLPLSSQWSFYLEPEFQYLLKPVYQDGIDSVNRANLFLKVGLRHLITLPSDDL